MGTKRTPQNQAPAPREIFNQQLFVTLGIILTIVGVPAGYIVRSTIPDKINVEIGKQYEPDGPLQKAVKHEIAQTSDKVTELVTQQGKMQNQLTDLSVSFQVYFGKQLVNGKVAENTLQHAIDFARTSQDKRERTVALRVAGNVLDKAAANHVVVNHKKVNDYGLTLLESDVEDQKEALSQAAKQRTLRFPPPSVPPGPKYIVGKDQVLDGTAFRDVTFVDCKIIYTDGWLELKNVHFINCTFDVQPENTGKEFYRVLFSSNEPIPTVTVKTQGAPPANCKDCSS